MRRALAAAAWAAAVGGCHPAAPPTAGRAAPTAGQGARTRVALARTLPPLDGRHAEVTLLEVTYPPGASSRPHRHPCPVVGYVVEGAVRMRVDGGPDVVYRVGDTFYEAPDALHATSANASRDRPATFLAYFTCDRQTPLSIPAPDSTRAPGGS